MLLHILLLHIFHVSFCFAFEHNFPNDWPLTHCALTSTPHLFLAIIFNYEQNTQTAEEDKSAKKAKEAKQMALAAMMPAIPLDGPVSVDGSNLSDFYYLACGEDEVLGESRGRCACLGG